VRIDLPVASYLAGRYFEDYSLHRPHKMTRNMERDRFWWVDIVKLPDWLFCGCLLIELVLLSAKSCEILKANLDEPYKININMTIKDRKIVYPPKIYLTLNFAVKLCHNSIALEDFHISIKTLPNMNLKVCAGMCWDNRQKQ
jgi:hypothetical protein